MIQEIDGVWTPGRQRRAAGSVGGQDADLAAGDEAPRSDEGAAGRCGDPGQAVQPEGPAGDPAPRGRVGARAGGARRNPGAGRHGGPVDRARGGLRRRLQLPARAGPRVRGGDAHLGGAPGDPRGDRRPADVRRALGREPAPDRPSREVGWRRGGVRPVLRRGEPERARGQRPGGGPARSRAGAAVRLDTGATRRVSSMRATGRWICCGAPGTGCRGSPSSRRWPRRSATRDWVSTSGCAARRPCGRPRSTSARPSSRERCGTGR